MLFAEYFVLVSFLFGSSSAYTCNFYVPQAQEVESVCIDVCPQSPETIQRSLNFGLPIKDNNESTSSNQLFTIKDRERICIILDMMKMIGKIEGKEPWYSEPAGTPWRISILHKKKNYQYANNEIVSLSLYLPDSGNEKVLLSATIFLAKNKRFKRLVFYVPREKLRSLWDTCVLKDKPEL